MSSGRFKSTTWRKGDFTRRGKNEHEVYVKDTWTVNEEIQTENLVSAYD